MALDIYSNRSTFKLIIILFALLIGGISVLYTNNMVSKLAEREKKLIDLAAKGYREIAGMEFTSSQGFLFQEIIAANNSVPVILTDEGGNILSYRNFEVPENMDERTSKAFFDQQLEEMRAEYKPIPIEIAGLKQYIYYKNSNLIRQLKFYPYIQLAVIGLFILMGYLAFSLSRNAEQNRVWEGWPRKLRTSWEPRFLPSWPGLNTFAASPKFRRKVLWRRWIRIFSAFK